MILLHSTHSFFNIFVFVFGQFPICLLWNFLLTSFFPLSNFSPFFASFYPIEFHLSLSLMSLGWSYVTNSICLSPSLTVHLFLRPSLLFFLPFPPFLPSFLPSFLPPYLSSFLLSSFPSFFPSLILSFLLSFLLSFIPFFFPPFLPSLFPSHFLFFLPSFLLPSLCSSSAVITVVSLVSNIMKIFAWPVSSMRPLTILTVYRSTLMTWLTAILPQWEEFSGMLV